MKIQYFHCKPLGEIRSGVAGGTARERARNEAVLKQLWGPYLPKLDEGIISIKSDNACLALVTVEERDTKLSVPVIAKDIISKKQRFGAKEVVLGAYAHASDDNAPAHKTLSLLREIAMWIVYLGPDHELQVVPFGWEKSLNIQVPLHRNNIKCSTFNLKNASWKDHDPALPADFFDRTGFDQNSWDYYLRSLPNPSAFSNTSGAPQPSRLDISYLDALWGIAIWRPDVPSLLHNLNEHPGAGFGMYQLLTRGFTLPRPAKLPFMDSS